MKPLIVANWKMNKTTKECLEFLSEIKLKSRKVEVVICPPFTLLQTLSKKLKTKKIAIGAQNMYYKKEGAFTGEISPAMLAEFNVKYVILGHSERRNVFGENNELINKKVLSAIENNIVPILCVGEKKEEREAKDTKKVIEYQLQSCLKSVEKEKMAKVVIAYEPVWAIGTGENATPEQAEEVHDFIRHVLLGLYDEKAGEQIRILYGGSVNEENAKGFLDKKTVNGLLVGGKSLDAKSFLAIINSQNA